MPRVTADERLDQLVDAALRVFSRKGFRRAQMDDVAAEMGVSKGTLYNYVESKEALFLLLVERSFLESGGPVPELPVRTPRRGTVTRRLRERLAERARLPALQTALAQETSPSPAAELEAVVRELYAVIAATRRAVTALERSALEMPEIAELWFGETRQAAIDELARYLEMRIAAGQLREVPDAATTARLILECITWFARHRHDRPFSEGLDDRLAEETVVDFVLGSLVDER
jgi:AcrR family transcriptional regulator